MSSKCSLIMKTIAKVICVWYFDLRVSSLSSPWDQQRFNSVSYKQVHQTLLNIYVVLQNHPASINKQKLVPFMLDSGKKIQKIMFDVYYHDQHAPTVLKRVKILKYSIFEIFNIIFENNFAKC